MSFWPLGPRGVEAGICGSRAELFSYLTCHLHVKYHWLCPFWLEYSLTRRRGRQSIILCVYITIGPALAAI